MDILNSFLMSLSVSTRNAIWYAFIGVLVIVLSACLLYYCIKKGYSHQTAVVNGTIVATVFIAVVLVGILRDELTNGAIFLSGVVEFIPCLLCTSAAMTKYLRCKFGDAADCVALSILLGRAFQGIGCCLVGCCQGVFAEWGIYSAVSKTTVVPVQAFEMLGLLCLWILTHIYYTRNHYETDGKASAITLIGFGTINFVTDIFTVTFPKIISATSVEGVFAFLNVGVGLIMLYISEKRKTNQTCVSSLWGLK